MKVALLQPNPKVGDFTGNAARLLAMSAQAADEGAELCVAPLYAACGRGTEELFGTTSFTRSAGNALSHLAADLHERKLPPLLIGDIASSGPCCGSTVHFFLLWEGTSSALPFDRILYASGNQPNADRILLGADLSLPNGHITVVMADDLFSLLPDANQAVTENIMRGIHQSGGRALVVLDAAAYCEGAPAVRSFLLGQLAQSIGIPVLYSNLTGGNDGLVCYGASAIYDGAGTLLAQAPLWEEGTAYHSLPHVHQEKKKENSRIRDFSVDPSALAAAGGCREEEIWAALVLGIKDFVRKSGFSRATVALSGGVDSALVTTLAVEALTAAHVSCVLLPSPYSSRSSIEDSLTLADNLGIHTTEIRIDPILAAFKKLEAAHLPPLFDGVSEENIQSRIRGDIMMAYAQTTGSLVLTTGNKSELAVGYCTLYGDMSGALSVIGDVYKTTVYALCHWRNSFSGEVIPRNILEKAPSAELRPDQVDSDALPPYNFLDAVLGIFIEEGEGEAEAIKRGFDPELVVRVSKLFNRAEFKRRQAPPILQVTSRCFGRGWNMPVVRI